MTLFEFILLAPISLFVIVNPFSSVPAFLVITQGDSKAERIRALRLGCLVAALIVFFFALAGQFLFSILGVTLPALQIAGGSFLFVIAFEMLRSPDAAPVRLTPEERDLAIEKPDIAITPLAVPLLSGPGAISTAMVLQTQADTFMHNVVLLVSVPLVYLAAYGVLRLSVSGAAWLNPIMLRILRRLMGLMFAVIAVQFIINGIGSLPFVSGR